METTLSASIQESSYRIFPRVQKNSFGENIEEVLHRKEETFRAKLEVLAGQVFQRLELRKATLENIESEREETEESLSRIGRAALYHWRDFRELSPFYENLFRLNKERREHDTECWRDVIMVMRALGSRLHN